MQSSKELKECLDSHLEAVVQNDEYKIKELFVKDRDIEYIVDIGANLGTSAFKFQTFYPNAKILVCEPEPELMKYAKLNTGNKLIYVQRAIIGDARKEVTFNVCAWAGNGHVDGHFRWDLYGPMGSKKVKEIKVSACTLKDLVDEYNFPRIDLLKIDTEGMESEILKAFQPYLKNVKHIRGEWHGDEERSIIREILNETHNVTMECLADTNGGIFGERKEELDKPEVLKDNIKRGITITTSAYTKDFLKDCLESIKETPYPILIVSNGNYKPDLSYFNRQYDLVINEQNQWELGGIQRGKEKFDEQIHLMDTTVVKDISMFDKLFAFAPNENVALTKNHFHYMGKYVTAKLPNLPMVDSKDVAIKLEAHWLNYYREFNPDLPCLSNVVEVVHGQRRMVLENIYMKKFKGTWMKEKEEVEPF